MKAYLVCTPKGYDCCCVVKLAETSSKARYAGFREMGGDPYEIRNHMLGLTVRRIPAYDGDDEDAAYRAYWTDHDDETGLPVGTDVDASEGDA